MNPPPFLLITGESFHIVSVEPGRDRGVFLLTMGCLPRKVPREAVHLLCQGPNREPVRLIAPPVGMSLSVRQVY